MTDRQDYQENKPETQQEPWEHQFGEAEADTSQATTRSKRHKKPSNNDSALAKVLFFVFIIALFLVGVTIIARWMQNTPNSPTPAVNNVISVRTSSSVAQSSSESSSQASSASSVASSESQSSVAQSSSSEEESSSSVAQSSSVSESSESESRPTTRGETTYTVKPGDNLYRIALNHGLTQAELMEYNGLTSTVINVGDVLRIPVSD